MGLTNFPQGISSFGSPVVGEYPSAGTSYFLDPTSGNDSYDGKSVDKAFKTLTAAYAAMADGDTLYYQAGSSAINLSATLTWARNYCRFIGVCAPTGVANRARIFQTSTATGLSPLIDITGSGNVFKNLYIFQGVADATSLIAVRVTGSRNYFENMHFAGGGHASNAVDGCASLNIAAGSENRFVGCTVGLDTIGAATGVDALLFSGVGAARNVFEKCHFSLWASNGGAAWIELSAIDSIDRFQIFDACWFTNLGTALTSGVVVPAGFDPANKRLLLGDCKSIGATKWDANDRGAVYGNMNAVTGADLSGVLVQIIS